MLSRSLSLSAGWKPTVNKLEFLNLYTPIRMYQLRVTNSCLKAGLSIKVTAAFLSAQHCYQLSNLIIWSVVYATFTTTSRTQNPSTPQSSKTLLQCYTLQTLTFAQAILTEQVCNQLVKRFSKSFWMMIIKLRRLKDTWWCTKPMLLQKNTRRSSKGIYIKVNRL
jgi:hypothetical protein